MARRLLTSDDLIAMKNGLWQSDIRLWFSSVDRSGDPACLNFVILFPRMMMTMHCIGEEDFQVDHSLKILRPSYSYGFHWQLSPCDTLSNIQLHSHICHNSSAAHNEKSQTTSFDSLFTFLLSPHCPSSLCTLHTASPVFPTQFYIITICV